MARLSSLGAVIAVIVLAVSLLASTGLAASLPASVSSPGHGSTAVSVGYSPPVMTPLVTAETGALPPSDAQGGQPGGAVQMVADNRSTVGGETGRLVGAPASPGGVPAASSGTVPVSQGTVCGAGPYPVLFTESGLPTSPTPAQWSVVVPTGGQPCAAFAGDSITIDLPSGMYSYTIFDVPGWHQTTMPYFGTITVSGAGLTEPTLVFMQVTYAVTFSEYGLASGVTWSVTVNGTPYEGTAPGGEGTLPAALLPNGTFTYVIADVPGWQLATPPYSGTGSVTGAPVNDLLIFSEVTFQVTFSENGLPLGDFWAVTLNGSFVPGLAGGLISFEEPNGTYPYQILASYPSGYSPSPSSGSEVVANSPVSVEVTFTPPVTTTYPLTFSEIGLPSGTWTVTINGTEYTEPVGTSIVDQLPSGPFTYTVTDYAGYHQDTLPYSGTGSIDGAPVTEPMLVFMHETYTVTFSESGVPSSGTWSVTLNGNASGAILGTTTSTTFSVGNGTFSYTVGTVSGYTPNPSSGSVTVNGANPATVSITFTPVSSTYTVTFTESGMPTGAGGGVNFNSEGLTPFTSGGTVAFSGVASGTYPYTITAGVGYALVTSTPSSPVTVSGSNVGVTVTFHALYTVTFSESGVPSSKTWSVTLNGNASGAILGTTTSTTFQIGNGTFSYAWGNTAGYHIQSPGTYTGSVTVHGANPSTVSVTFTHETYTVTFSESGVPSSGTWSVTLNGNASGAIPGTTTSTTFSVGNGTFSYTVGTVSGYTPNPSSGSVTVNGANPATVSITFTPVSSTYTVTFTESGMPTGAGGGVNFNSEGLTPFTSGGTVAFSGVASGTYPYTITAGAGYALVTSTPTSPVTVSGSNVGVTVTFHALYTVTFSESGVPSSKTWSVALNGNASGAILGTTTSTTFQIGNGTFSYAWGSTAGYHIQSPGTYTGSVTVHGANPSTVSVTFTHETYTVTFSESGVPGSGTWSVTLNGNASGAILGTTTSTTFSVGNGTFSYTVGTVSGYTPNPSSGSVTVNGANPATVSITFTPVSSTYTVTFTESGMPTGAGGGVNFNGEGLTPFTSGGTVAFSGVANGTYPYAITTGPDTRW